MTLPPDNAVMAVTADDLDAMAPWIARATRRFFRGGRGPTAFQATAEALRMAITGPDLLFAARVGPASLPAGLVVLVHSRWEEGVVGRPFARMTFLGAADYPAASALARAAAQAAQAAGVVLMTANPGESPMFVNVALADAGFHIGSMPLTLGANVETVWTRLRMVPDDATFRIATADDAPAVAALAADGLEDARFVADPHFPREWGRQLYAAWGAALTVSAEHQLVLCVDGDRLLGFGDIQHDVTRRTKVPGLLVVDRAQQGSGVGPRLLKYVMQHYRERGIAYPLIGTERTNVGINSMYSRLGYYLVDSGLVLHWTPRPG